MEITRQLSFDVDCTQIINIILVNNFMFYEYRQVAAVVPAAGKGTRLGADTPKQYIDVSI